METARLMFLDGIQQFLPGDPPPEGYIEWHAWAQVQDKAGLDQTRCRRCRLFRFPQEFAVPEMAEGGPVCRVCAAREEG